MDGRVRAILIAGPTASGKSALALALARRHGGTVINADSMQVYRDLRLLTARPAPDEEARAPHRLYGTVDGAVNFSVGHYLAEAGAALREAWAAGSLPIVVGGTGLYFTGLTEGLSEIPPVSEAVRAEVRAEAEGRATPDLHAALAGRDPEGAARLDPNDRLRVLRALEVLAATGRPIAAFHAARRPGPLTGLPCTRLFLTPDRETLRARIDARFLAMMAAGALDEVRALAARGLDPMLPVMRAHGVPGLIAHLRGALSGDEAVARGQADTRRYAKRQVTWFRHQAGPDWTWVTPEAAMAGVAAGLWDRPR
ncbi:tRNA (adenosine(37)-N6)-dimethylallyltransferase MiaA [Methylobacterium terrae]|uniref:tRNA dimethylallyltransferase n=1 Tax=Methylobacterium terrae TaxID=2202827 RepID=A0A2U8WK78_9HYPH|nr:tRNA (adenosine(37)-N6)-dimethylallyltransferase MiaA [Methylobacterium terrae]AWN45978.1 tRNA (adenosine(37)-N6)-dimethylallyltransferase MiaA [Methylobacterium terrae]